MSGDWLTAIVASPWAIVLLCLLVAADGLFPPIPSEALLTAMAAVAAASDPARLAVILPAAAVGSVAGDVVACWLGRRIDLDRTRLLTGARARRIVAWARPALQRRALVFMLTARFLPGGRTVSTVSSGMLGLPWRRFVPMTALASAVWSLYMAALGIGSARWLSSNPLVAAVAGIVIGLVLGVVFDQVARWRGRRRPEAGA